MLGLRPLEVARVKDDEWRNRINVPKVTQLLSGRVRVPDKAISLLNPCPQWFTKTSQNDDESFQRWSCLPPMAPPHVSHSGLPQLNSDFITPLLQQLGIVFSCGNRKLE